MGSRDQRGGGSAEGGRGAAQGEPETSAEPGLDAAAYPITHPRQSPLYHAHHADRYQRQSLIAAYEEHVDCKLVVAIDFIDFDFVQNLEEHLLKEDGSRELHVLLRSPGGDGEQALRAVRSLQQRCSRLVFVIPDMAKSAATLMALGADQIRLGPTSDLGPIDPQMQIGGRWFAAKSIMSAVQEAQTAVEHDRSLTPLWASLLAEVTALDYQEADAEIQRTGAMVRQALGYRTDPPQGDDLASMATTLVEELQDTPTSHATTMGASELRKMGLPVVDLDPCSWEWECIWRLWTSYWVQIRAPIYESTSGSYRPDGPHPA
ncbi:MAG: SDH family Clp fold serine proteinase [Acidimicrobiales bacterium]